MAEHQIQQGNENGDKPILVTGATGYLGGALLEALVHRGMRVRALCRRLPPLADRHQVAWVVGDILEPETLRPALEGCHQVYHCAGIAALFHPQPTLFYQVNTQGTFNLLTAARQAGVGRVVCTSSAGVLGRSLRAPLTEDDVRLHPFDNDHDLSKYLAEEKAKEMALEGLDIIRVNPSRIFGPGRHAPGNIVHRTIRHFLDQRFCLLPHNGEAITNYAFIDDVVDGHIRAMQFGRNGQRYTLGGENLTYNQFFSLLEQITGLRRRRLHIPPFLMAAMARTGLALDHLAGCSPFITLQEMNRLTQHRVLSIEKSINELGYQPTDIATALKITLSFLEGKTSSLPFVQAREISRA